MIRYNCQIYKKWYRLFCFQNRNRITDLPKKKKKMYGHHSGNGVGVMN